MLSISGSVFCSVASPTRFDITKYVPGSVETSALAHWGLSGGGRQRSGGGLSTRVRSSAPPAPPFGATTRRCANHDNRRTLAPRHPYHHHPRTPTSRRRRQPRPRHRHRRRPIVLLISDGLVEARRPWRWPRPPPLARPGTHSPLAPLSLYSFDSINMVSNMADNKMTKIFCTMGPAVRCPPKLGGCGRRARISPPKHGPHPHPVCPLHPRSVLGRGHGRVAD